MKIQVLDPPNRSLRLCDLSVGPHLVRFATDLDWLNRQGVEDERYDPSQRKP